MFPIHDRGGRVVAFGGRAMDPGAKAKYLNSPETELFHKGSLLFNHHRARKAAHDKGRVIAVEGYVDVIAMTQVGFPETVAGLGTALTADHCALLWTMSEEPVLCFDGDKAGRKAAFRAIETALPLIGAGKTLRFALLPEGQDPDDLARSGGPEAIAGVIDRAHPFAEMLFLRETEGQVFDTPDKRAALERRLRDLTGQIGDETLRKHYGADMGQRLSALFGFAAPGARNGGQAYAAREARPRFQRRSGPWDPGPQFGVAGQPLPPTTAAVFARRDPPREVLILATLLGHPGLLETHFEELVVLEFASPALSEFRSRLIDLAPEAHDGAEALSEALAGAGLAAERDRLLAAAAKMPDWWCLRPEADIGDADLVLRQSLALQRKAGALHKDLKLAEAALAADPTEQNLARLLDIKANLADLAHAEAASEGFGETSGRRMPAV